MRVAENNVLCLGQVDIDDVELDARSRDDVPAALQGIQFLHRDKDVLQRILHLLSSDLFRSAEPEGDSRGAEEHRKRNGIDPNVGRPGMSLWSILVLAILKQALNCDYDRLHDLACQHLAVRRMMGLSDVFEQGGFSYRTIVRNVSLFTAELLDEINQVVVQAGHQLKGLGSGQPLQARCDSFVVETDVEYPTDVRLLWDALRSLLRMMGTLYAAFGVAGWRQHRQLMKTGERLFGRVRTARQYRKNPQHVRRHTGFGKQLAERARESLETLAERGVPEAKLQTGKDLAGLVEKLADQVERRILEGEVIPASEKIYSVFVPFTRWCSKGKAGVPVELGVPVCVVEDEQQFLLSCRIMWTESDVDLVPEIIEETKGKYPELEGCSFDKGFWSPRGKATLGRLLKNAVLPKKGRLSKADRKREGREEFRAGRKAHPAVESAINNLEQRGLDRVREKSKAGFARTVALSMLAANVHRIGMIVRDRERERLRRTGLRRAA
ncbi:MAG: ISNCY family transposase [Bryobacterales bacterium]|nr:ISNCY family transposase [Bryobacterales bacterium]